MNSYITKFACVPYLAPPPPNPSIKTTTLHHEETLLTFFEDFDHTLIKDRSEKIRMLNNLEVNFPSLCNLQSDRLPNGAEPNKTSGTIMNFLTHLADHHIFSLCPLPKFDTLKLDFLINHCLNYHIPIERAVWAIHHYAIKMEITAETMTNTLTRIQPNDAFFFCKLCNGIYRKNLLNHAAFLKWAANNIRPDYLDDFEKDFVKTHSLLYYALTSHNQSGISNFPRFLDILKKSLLIYQSHIIQFSVLCENKKIFSLNEAKYIYALAASNNNLLKRTRHIHQLLVSNEFKCDLSSSLLFMIPNIIFKDFPHYNFEIILNNIRTASFFLSSSKKSKIALNICKAVTCSFDDSINVSALVAWLIRKLHIKLEIDSFTEWIYELIESTLSEENDKTLTTLKFLLYELQYQGIFNYKHFHKYIHKKRYFSTRPNSTRKILSELPILLYDLHQRYSIQKVSKNIQDANECLHEVLYDLNRLLVDKEIEAKLTTIKEDVIQNVELIKTLPYVARFIVSVWLIVDNDRKKVEKRLSQRILFNFLNDVNVTCLIPELSRNSDFVPQNAKHFLAAYEAHGLKGDLKITDFLGEKYSPSTLINKAEVSEFVLSFSHLCSLHVLDLFFSVRTRDEMSFSLSLLFDDLMTFKNLSYSYFYQFFTEFYFAKIVPDSVKLFVTVFLSSCYLKRKKSDGLIINENLRNNLNDIDHEKDDQKFNDVRSFSSHFIRSLFIQNVIEPFEYIMIVFDIIQSQLTQENGSFLEEEIEQDYQLFELFFQILFEYIESNRCEVLKANDFLTMEVVDLFNSFIPLFAPNPSVKKSFEYLYHNFLTHLRDLKPPQFNKLPTPAFSSALYTLLPAELFSDDCGTIIDYFKKNLNCENLHLWCSWLRDCIEYKPGFPVAQREPLPESKKLKYITELVDTFWNSNNKNSDEEKDELYIKCRWILCESKSISNAVLQKCINKSFFDFNYLHPALISADELILECLCDKLRETNSNLIDNNVFVFAASSVFIIFVSKFSDNYKYYSLIISIANKLLEWIMKLWEEESAMLMTLIDTFNFIVCWSFDHSIEEESSGSSSNNNGNDDVVGSEQSQAKQQQKQKQQKQQQQHSHSQSSSIAFRSFGSFQEMLHSKIIPNLNKLPREIKRKIILNKPRQAFKIIPNPLFSDFASQDNESGNQFQIHSSFNEGGESNYHNDFGFFDDDVVQLFWG